MSDSIKVDTQSILAAINEAWDLVEGLKDVEVVVATDSVNGRRNASAQRAVVKADLSYASHLLEKARILIDGEHHKITRAAKEASGAYA